VVEQLRVLFTAIFRSILRNFAQVLARSSPHFGSNTESCNGTFIATKQPKQNSSAVADLTFNLLKGATYAETG
jgi:hypothetical protein